MRTVLHHQIVMMRGFDNFNQFYNIFMFKSRMYFHFGLKQLQVGSSKLVQVYNFYSISFVRRIDFNPFVDHATVSLAQLVSGVIFIFADSYLALFESSVIFIASVAAEKVIILLVLLCAYLL